MNPNPRLREIEQQLAQLEWTRKQNDRLIKQGLESSKLLKQKDAVIQISLNNYAEKSSWQNAVIQDELSRPLVLSDQEMAQILRTERIATMRLKKYCETKHSATLKNRDVISKRTDCDKPHNINRLKQLSELDQRVLTTLKSITEEKSPIRSKFSGPGMKECLPFEKVFM